MKGITGIKDLDFKIFSLLDDGDLKNVLLINKYIYELLLADFFWKYRCRDKFGKVLDINTMEEIVMGSDVTWKIYYIKLRLFVNNYIMTGNRHMAILKGRIVNGNKTDLHIIKLTHISKYIDTKTFQYREKYMEGKISMKEILKEELIIPLKLFRKICSEIIITIPPEEDIEDILNDRRVNTIVLKENNWKKILMDIHPKVVEIVLKNLNNNKINMDTVINFIWRMLLDDFENSKIPVRKLLKFELIREKLEHKMNNINLDEKDLQKVKRVLNIR